MASSSTSSPPPTDYEKDPNLAAFTTSYDPSKPKTWPLAQKWLLVTTVSLFAFMTPLASTIVVPALPQIDSDLQVQGGEVASALMLSIFLFGYALGPFVFSPLSEIHGRVPILQLGNSIFLVFNLVCGFAQTQVQLTVFRFFAGVGASASLGIGGGVLADCFEAGQLGSAVAVYSLMPLLGPAFGPVIGPFVTQYSTWRWCFWAISIADAVIQVAGLALLRESWAPKILQRRKKALVKETGNTDLFTESDAEQKDRSQFSVLAEALKRPLQLLTGEPIVQVICLYMAYLYGVTFLVLSTFSSLWTEQYGFPLGTGNLNYLALGLGYTLATQVSARLNDYIYARLSHSHSPPRPPIPEYRLPTLFLGAILNPAGLIIYAWTSQTRQHWALVDLGVAIYAAGTFTSFQCLQTYLIEAYKMHAASAMAAATLLRSIFGTVFPLFAPKLYEALGYGWGTTTIALVVVGIGWPAPFLLWRYGPRLRARSPRCQVVVEW